jgi:hypothetical protein
MSGSKDMHFKEVKIEREFKLQRMKTTTYPTPQDTSEEDSQGEDNNENANHFCKSAYFY